MPFPDSGHRCGDIVLHDGDPVGTRRLGDREVGVFNEIALWRRSPAPTLTATVQAPDLQAVGELSDLFGSAGGTAEDWTQNVRALCKACSEGSPVAHDDHQPGGHDGIPNGGSACPPTSNRPAPSSHNGPEPVGSVPSPTWTLPSPDTRPVLTGRTDL